MLEEIKYKEAVLTEPEGTNSCSWAKAEYKVKNKYAMKKMAYLLVFGLLLFSLLSVFTANKISAQDIGGEAKIISTITEENSDYGADLRGELELEWFLPYGSAIDFENRAVITLDGSEADIWFKKFYIREKLGPLNAQIGRQPVSWSYGALINPIDYSLGAENLDRESRAKYVDGIELYYPINWGSGISLIGSNLENEKDHKWALRGRATLKGYDLALSYVNTPSEEDKLERYGFTFKGDLGPVGIYGALGNWKSEEIDYDIFQFGSDYSYSFLSGSRLYLQGEYLVIAGIEDELSELGIFQGLGSSFEENFGDDNIKLINTNISYDINDFTSIGVMTVSYLGDGSTLFIPNYSYLFSSNLLFELRGTAALGNEDELLGGDRIGVELKLSYTF